jgi:hypothetical protein
MKSFSKLSLSQQVLKRYEMMNKEAPTMQSLAEAKLKKQQANRLNNSATTSAGAGSEGGSPSNTPRIIFDKNDTNKIPLVMRQKYLKFIFENGKTYFPSIEKACEKAAEQEKSIYDRSKNKTIYINLAANLIKSMRVQTTQTVAKAQLNDDNNKLNKKKLITNEVNEKKAPTDGQTVPTTSYSHETMLHGPKANKISYSINRVKRLEFKDLDGKFLMLIIFILKL